MKSLSLLLFASVVGFSSLSSAVPNDLPAQQTPARPEYLQSKIELLKLTQFLSSQIENEIFDSLQTKRAEFQDMQLKIERKDGVWRVTRTEGTDIPCATYYIAVYSQSGELTTFREVGPIQCLPQTAAQ